MRCNSSGANLPIARKSSQANPEILFRQLLRSTTNTTQETVTFEFGGRP